jgi:hypothetical protein
LNTSFSSPGFESNSNFYNPNWSNHSDFLWHAHATENFAPHSFGLHHPEYPQSNIPFSNPSSCNYPPKQSSLEETLKEFNLLTGQSLQEITDATMANTEAVARLEGQIGHLVAEFNRIEEEELQSQEMARGQYMIDEDCHSDPHHEHVQTTITLVNEEIANEVVSEFSLEDPKMECFTPDDCDLNLDRLVVQDGVLHDLSLEDPEMEHFTQDKEDLDLDRMFDHANTFSKPNLEDPSGECFEQIEYDLDHDKFL